MTYDCLSTAILAAQDSTIVSLTVTTVEGCTDRAQILIIVERIPRIYISNIASSRDGQKFSIYTSKDIERIDALAIYDRWGNLVYLNENFEPNDQSQAWDGTRDGRDVEQGVCVLSCVDH